MIPRFFYLQICIDFNLSNGPVVTYNSNFSCLLHCKLCTLYQRVGYKSSWFNLTIIPNSIVTRYFWKWITKHPTSSRKFDRNFCKIGKIERALICLYYQAVSKRNSLASYLYLRLFNEVLMSANKSLMGEEEKCKDLTLTLDLVDGYGIKYVNL